MSSADVIPFSQNNSRASSYGLSLDRLEEMVDLETSKSTFWILVMLACEAKPRPVLCCGVLWCAVFTYQWDLLSVMKDGCESATQDHPILQQLISNSTKRPTDLLWMHSILFYSILFYSILFYSILFYSILFYSILFYLLFNFIFLHSLSLYLSEQKSLRALQRRPMRAQWQR